MDFAGIAGDEQVPLSPLDWYYTYQIQTTIFDEFFLIYLELGCIPLGIIIRTRRLNYLHHLVTRKENEMLCKTFWTQWHHPVRGDWVLQVIEDLEMFETPCNLPWIRSKSKLSFKTMVRSKTKELSFKLLSKMKEKHSKMENLLYTELKMQTYLENHQIKVYEVRTLFKFRTRIMKFWGIKMRSL